MKNETDNTTGSDCQERLVSRWSYSPYRATLKLDGKPFALVTPDGKNALNEADQKTLLDALNSPANAQGEPRR